MELRGDVRFSGSVGAVGAAAGAAFPPPRTPVRLCAKAEWGDVISPIVSTKAKNTTILRINIILSLRLAHTEANFWPLQPVLQWLLQRRLRPLGRRHTAHPKN